MQNLFHFLFSALWFLYIWPLFHFTTIILTILKKPVLNIFFKFYSFWHLIHMEAKQYTVLQAVYFCTPILSCSHHFADNHLCQPAFSFPFCSAEMKINWQKQLLQGKCKKVNRVVGLAHLKERFFLCWVLFVFKIKMLFISNWRRKSKQSLFAYKAKSYCQLKQSSRAQCLDCWPAQGEDCWQEWRMPQPVSHAWH